MSTYTDGVPPSVSPGPDEGPDVPGHVGDAAGDPVEDGTAADSGSAWLREEIQRRMASARSGSGGRHARHDAPDSTTSVGYVPRHSVATPGPGAPRPGPAAPSPRPGPRGRRGPDAWSGPGRPHGTGRDVRSDLDGGPIGYPSTGSSAGPGGASLFVPPDPATAPDIAPDPLAPDLPAPHLVDPDLVDPDLVDPEVTTPGSVRPGPTARGTVAPDTGRARTPGPVRVDPELPAGIDEPDDPGTTDPSAVGRPADPVFTARTPTGSRDRQSAADEIDGLERAQEPSGGTGRGDVDRQGRRVRVVLAERKGVARPVRTVVDIQEDTGVGELLRSNLIGSQLTVALRFAVGAGLTLAMLPLLFAFFPEIGRINVLGLRLPWLVLGVVVYPFLFGLGLWHTRTAERVEQNFADHVQD